MLVGRLARSRSDRAMSFSAVQRAVYLRCASLDESDVSMPRAMSPCLIPPTKAAESTLIVRPGSRKQRLAVLQESANVWKGVLTADECVGTIATSLTAQIRAALAYCRSRSVRQQEDVRRDRAPNADPPSWLVLVPHDDPDIIEVLASLELYPRTALLCLCVSSFQRSRSCVAALLCGRSLRISEVADPRQAPAPKTWSRNPPRSWASSSYRSVIAAMVRQAAFDRS